MKTAGKIFALIIIALFISKCENSQGYDPYATITPIYDDIPGIDTIGNSPQTEFEPDSTQFDFQENYWWMRRSNSVRWLSKLNSKKIILDTANGLTKFFMEFSVESARPQSYFKVRGQYVQSFEIKFGAILEEEVYRLNMDRDSRRWFLIRIMRNIDNRIISYNPTQVAGQIFINELNNEKGIIRGTIFIDLSKTSKIRHLQLQYFKCDFKIFY